jgi:hypothetical protein
MRHARRPQARELEARDELRVGRGGDRIHSRPRGAFVVVETVGQILRPAIAGAIFDATESHEWALAMYAGTFAAAFALFAVALRLPQPRTARNARSPGPRGARDPVRRRELGLQPSKVASGDRTCALSA